MAQTVEEIDEKIKDCDKIIENQEKRIQHLQSTVFQLSNFFIVFQGVIFTVISSGTSSLTCHEKWLPITLSVIISTLNLIAISIVGWQYINSLGDRDKTITRKNTLARLKPQQAKLSANTPTSSTQATTTSTSEAAAQGRQSSADAPTSITGTINGAQAQLASMPTDPDRQLRIIVYGICMLVFIIFAVITPIGCNWILCKGRDFKTIYGDERCVRLCDHGKCVKLCPQYI